MLRLLFDENFHYDIVRGVRRRLPEADLVRVQDEGLRGVSDPDLLAWAAAEQRILVTHDLKTMPKYTYERIAAGQYVAGVFALHTSIPISVAIEELTLLIACSDASEWENGVFHLPM